MRELIQSSLSGKPRGPYSPAIKQGNTLYLAGKGPFGPDGSRDGDNFEDQARATFRYLELICNEAGTSLKHALRFTVYVTSMRHFEDLNRVMAEFVEEPYPARTTIPVDLVGFDIEVDAIVHIPHP